MEATPITFESLRGAGFRLQISFGNYEPHMRIEINREVDSSLEIGQCGMRKEDWGCWIVSESAARYGKFCFLRTVWTMAQVAALYEALTDSELRPVEFDPDEFHEGLVRTRALCLEHWKKFYNDEAMRRHVLIKF